MIAIYLYLLFGLILSLPALFSPDLYREIELMKIKYRNIFDYTKVSDRVLFNLGILSGVVGYIIRAPIIFFMK